jgi:hypothetical protein
MANTLPGIVLQIYVIFLSNPFELCSQFRLFALENVLARSFFLWQCNERMKISNLIHVFLVIIYLAEDRYKIIEIQKTQFYLKLWQVTCELKHCGP